MSTGEREMWAMLGVTPPPADDSLKARFDALGIRDQGYSEKQKREIIDFVTGLPDKTDDELRKVTEQFIWLSAYANNNPRSAYHPMCDATYEEWNRRGNVKAYRDAHATVVRQNGHA